MATRIRLRRVGRRHQPAYRIVVTERSAARDGRSVSASLEDSGSLSGEMLGGGAGFHWFPSVRPAAEYARHRAGMLADEALTQAEDAVAQAEAVAAAALAEAGEDDDETSEVGETA